MAGPLNPFDYAITNDIAKCYWDWGIRVDPMSCCVESAVDRRNNQRTTVVIPLLTAHLPLLFILPPPFGRASPPPQLCGPISASVGLRGLVDGRLAARPKGRSPA
jgi:hypothetical protein